MTLIEFIEAMQHLADTCENEGEKCKVNFSLPDGAPLILEGAKITADIDVNLQRGALEECPSWNDLYVQKHWSNRREVVRAIHKIVGLYAPKMDKPIAVPVHVTVTAYRRRLIDADNVPAKFYVDGLCQAGVLNDDTKRYVDAVTTRCEQGDPMVVIAITRGG